jgi:hypothetical protein
MQTRSRKRSGAKVTPTILQTQLPLQRAIQDAVAPSPMSPITPSTPPYFYKRLQGTNSNIDGTVTGENTNTPPPTRRRHLISHDEDELMANRASLDSTASTILGEEEDDNDRDFDWTEDQVNILVRVGVFFSIPRHPPPQSKRLAHFFIFL